jgi:subtilisin family serine protease
MNNNKDCQLMHAAPTVRYATAILLACAAFSAPVQAQVAAGDYARGRILVEARPGLSDAQLDKLVKAHGGAKRRKLGQSRVHLIELQGNVSEAEAVATLSRRPEIRFAELDRKVSPTLAVTDPYAGSAWHLGKIGAPAAWDQSQGAGVTIAVLDSGVLTSHPDLKDRLVPGYNVYGNNTDVSDVCGHGTAVAGSAAASTNNGVGVAGVAGAARIMPVKIAFADSTGCHAYLSTIASGITYAADNGARIANVSYGSLAGSATVQSAARYMKSKGGLVFISAGNANLNDTTVSDGSMIVVSATDSNDAKASFSNYGAYVTLAAPGTGIWTTDMNGAYSAWNGTSFSSPVAAGVAALMMGARPDLAGAQIEALLLGSATDLGAAGRDPVYGYGRVHAAAAVAAALAYVAPPDTTAPTASIGNPLANSSVSGLVPVNVAAADNVGVARVDLSVNGTVVASATAAPYSFSWDSNGVANGMARLVAVAHDAAGNAGASSEINVNVANASAIPAADTVAPTLVISNPTSGSVSGTVAVTLSASDNAAASGIVLSVAIDGVTRAQGSGSALNYSWNTRKSAAGQHVISATARDAAGNTSTASVTVTSR